MGIGFSDAIAKLSKVDVFKRDTKSHEVLTGMFVGRPFYLDYERSYILIADAWKQKAKGIPQGSFLLAYYENEANVEEALLLRVLGPTKLPTDADVISSMVEYYKDNLKTNGASSQLDTFTRYEFSFSGLECRVLGSFYHDDRERTCFGADVENFYSAHNYSVVKPHPEVLAAIVNFREGEVAGNPTDIRMGKVRYSSARRFQAQDGDVPVFVSPKDFLGKRTALFGMTRTGKSNTVKKIIQASVVMSGKAPYSLEQPVTESVEARLEPFSPDGLPKYPVGQIIFDINGEYANANLQDEGTAIFEMYRDQVTRFSILDKKDFKVMKTNFYEDIEAGFEILSSLLVEDTTRFVQSFRTVDLSVPEDKKDNVSFMTRHNRQIAAYKCCLYLAGFKPGNKTIQFQGTKELNDLSNIDPSKGISLDQAVNWFSCVWEAMEKGISMDNGKEFFTEYKREHEGREWADEDLKALLVMLTRKRTSGAKTANCAGFRVLKCALDLHTASIDKPYADTILELIRQGKIVIADLS